MEFIVPYTILVLTIIFSIIWNYNSYQREQRRKRYDFMWVYRPMRSSSYWIDDNPPEWDWPKPEDYEYI